MIRISEMTSAAQAKKYFREQLEVGDYYIKGQELQGVFMGKTADLLGVSGPINQERFFRLCDNLHPLTGEQLTVRNKTNRRVGYDINFHCPKSLTIAYLFHGDERILRAFQKSVRYTMRLMEQVSRPKISLQV